MFSHILIGLIRAYRLVLAPHIGPCCRFTPSCSHYAMEAIRRHGPFRGLRLSAARLLRCRPFGPSGFDPVPPSASESRLPPRPPTPPRPLH